MARCRADGGMSVHFFNGQGVPKPDPAVARSASGSRPLSRRHCKSSQKSWSTTGSPRAGGKALRRSPALRRDFRHAAPRRRGVACSSSCGRVHTPEGIGPRTRCDDTQRRRRHTGTVDASSVVPVLASAVSASAAAFGAWVGYLQYRDRRSPATPASPAEAQHGTQSAPPGRRGDQSATVVGPAATTGAGAPRVDLWNVEWTSEKLATRAAVAIGASVVSCLCFATMVLIGVVIDSDGSVDGAAAGVLGLALVLGIVAILVATGMAVRYEGQRVAGIGARGGAPLWPCGLRGSLGSRATCPLLSSTD